MDTRTDRSFSRMSRGVAAAASIAAAAMLGAVQAAADEENFYEGQTITIIVGFGAGGGYDAYGRLAADHLGRHIPGSPDIIVQNMPGGGGRLAANQLFSVAPQNGTALGVIVQSIALDSLIGEIPEELDPREFNFIGRLTSTVEIQYSIDPASPARTLEDVKEHEVIVAATGPSSASSMVPKLLNEIIGTRFRIVQGYAGTAEAALAMEQGEVDAIMQSVEILERTRSDALADGSINLLWQLAIEPHPHYPEVPTVGSLGDAEEDRLVLQLVAGTSEIGRSLVAPPGVPQERVELLRSAFDAMIEDPEFQASAAERQLALNPLPGERLQEQIAETMMAPPEVVERIRSVMAEE